MSYNQSANLLCTYYKCISCKLWVPVNSDKVAWWCATKGDRYDSEAVVKPWAEFKPKPQKKFEGKRFEYKQPPSGSETSTVSSALSDVIQAMLVKIETLCARVEQQLPKDGAALSGRIEELGERVIEMHQLFVKSHPPAPIPAPEPMEDTQKLEDEERPIKIYPPIKRTLAEHNLAGSYSPLKKQKL